MRVRIVSAACVCLAVLLGVCVSTSQAVMTLSDGNSMAVIDPNTQAGMSNWTVDGRSQLYQQWFWYRVGASGPESSLDKLATPVISQPTPDTASLTYTGTGLTIKANYTLMGGSVGSGTADITEQLRITNTGASSLNVHFFQYSDFNLGGTPLDDTVKLMNANTVRQWDSTGILSETVATPAPSHTELGFFSTTRDRLNDSGPTTLDDIAGPRGPGDVTWAFEWDLNIAAGSNVIISKDKNFSVPEPMTMLAVGSAVAGVGAYIRRRRQALA